LKYNKKFFSVKAKTIILVLAIYFILSLVFFFIRYLDIKEFALADQKSQLQRVELVYNETFKRISKFYITRGYANINSYGIKEAFAQNDSNSLHTLSLPRWNVIKKENTFIKSFCFYDKNGKILTFFGEKPESRLLFVNQHQKGYAGFWYDAKSFNFHAVSEARDANSNIVGYIEFIINPKFFLSEIRKLTNIYTYIIYTKKDEKKITFKLKKNIVFDDIVQNKKIDEAQIIHIKNKIYMPYIIQEKGIAKDNNFKILFLQNISHWKNILDKSILQNLILLIVLMLATSVLINYGFNIILKELDESNRKLKKSQDDLKEINENLQIEIDKEIKLKLKKEREANEKERILAHQSKLASMGEMIGNIAHQWRQPLTELSSILINLELFYEMGKLTKEKFHTKVEEASKQIVFMSKTIDDFRNFFISSKKKEKHNISNIINNVHNLIFSSLKNNNIELALHIEEDFEVFVFPNEIAQAILNILSNAKDVLLERDVHNAHIKLNVFTKDSKNIITISDNAGGIKITPIDKIFEPYFSTKHAKSGTGIGLYMTKSIIEQNNNAKIEVINYEKGALFTIIF